MLRRVAGFPDRSARVVTTVPPCEPSSPMAAVVDRALGASGWDGRRPVFVESDANDFRSSASAHVISIRIGEEVVARFFCKEGPLEHLGTETFRWGLADEAAVYRHVLTPLQIGVPAFHDSWTDPDTRSCVRPIDFGRHLAAGRISHLLRVPGLNAALLDTENGCRRAGHLAGSLESWESE